MSSAPHIMIIEGRYHEDTVAELTHAAIAELEAADCTFERFAVPGALEIPAAIQYAVRSLDFFSSRRRFDGYVILGAIIKEHCTNYNNLCAETLRSINNISIQHTLAIGNGIIMADNHTDANERAQNDSRNIGTRAAISCLDMIDLKSQFRLFPR